MLISPDYRVRLSDQPPVVATVPELEAVFVGAAAAAPAFDAAATAVAAAAQLGFVPAPDDTSLTALPLAFSDAAAFAAAFPGDDTWLARAVRDYFNAGGLRAWVVRVEVDPTAPLNAYLRATRPLISALPPSGVDIAMQIPSAGLLVLPDLEYLCLASVSAPAPPMPTLPPVPAGFRPVNDFVTPPPADTQPPAPPPAGVAPHDVLMRVDTRLKEKRPDMLCLFALPVGSDETLSVPALLKRIVNYLSGGVEPARDLPRVQAFAPLLRDSSGAIASPSGVIAGVMGASAQRVGVWRSVAGRTLPLGGTPLRPIESNALDQLRKSGVATLRFAPGGTVLDDDILACHDAPGSAARRAAGTRRLMGWLVRNLQSFGEHLIFENVVNGGTVELILTDLFDALLKGGALNGRQVADAVIIKRRSSRANDVEYDITVDTALAVETIELRFVDGELTATLGAAP
jgi:hypothetical protein